MAMNLNGSCSGTTREGTNCLKIQRSWQENCCKSRIINMGRLCLQLQKLFLFSVTRGRSYSCVLLCVASVVKLLFYL